MKHTARATSIQSNTYIDTSAAEKCNCISLTPWHKEQDATGDDVEQLIPAHQELNGSLRITLSRVFPRSSPLSVMLLHISQREPILIAPKSTTFHKRVRYHAPASFLEQVLANVRRTIRASDQILLYNGAGAAIIFPDVDQEGAYNILERTYHGINLLQPETVIPPLKLETDILLGIGSYPKPGSSLEDLLYHTSTIARRLTLRPAFSIQFDYTKVASTRKQVLPAHHDDTGNHDHIESIPARQNSVPFMQLPKTIPNRLKSLIPYRIALQLRCAPVGRDHNRLTVAMADPTDTFALDELRATTGMTIFPVSCEVAELEALLANAW